MTKFHAHHTNELLGYPADARLLIVNADDFGMCHAINQGIYKSLQEGVVTSTSLMVPCPWASHAIYLLKENPSIQFAVHLTVLCDTVLYPWGALSPKEKVPTLLDKSGFFYTNDRMAEFLAQAALREVEMEFREQIETALRSGLKPTHLDWHCLHNGGRPDILDMTFNLAREYGLALRISDPEWIVKLQDRGLPTDEYELLDSFSLNTVNKSAQYARLLRELPAGLSEWAVHPALDDAEMHTIEPDEPVRQTDYAFVTSEEAASIIRQEGIFVLNYKPLQAAWQAIAPAI
jgi:chitin disaccharide deacetylase